MAKTKAKAQTHPLLPPPPPTVLLLLQLLRLHLRLRLGLPSGPCLTWSSSRIFSGRGKRASPCRTTPASTKRDPFLLLRMPVPVTVDCCSLRFRRLPPRRRGRALPTTTTGASECAAAATKGAMARGSFLNMLAQGVGAVAFMGMGYGITKGK